ncbi:hypothetical protein NDU88_012895 [Pleurodeles waltl]|uniref:Uncharacterized protein n=1 Tax=Pleurodeles waltl TaxID=8319 RepID=A0AAV7R1E9_PLEWA|nr:hypothetical protein NDU88_012895 [Pleurodeles waltl]
MDSASDPEDPSEALHPDPPEGEGSDPGAEDHQAAGGEGEDEDEDAFIRLSRRTQSPEAAPWEQRSAKMKVVYLADRAFLGFLALFVCILALELLYKVAYLVPWRVIYRALASWMVAQEEGEELLEL